MPSQCQWPACLIHAITLESCAQHTLFETRRHEAKGSPRSQDMVGHLAYTVWPGHGGTAAQCPPLYSGAFPPAQGWDPAKQYMNNAAEILMDMKIHEH